MARCSFDRQIGFMSLVIALQLMISGLAGRTAQAVEQVPYLDIEPSCQAAESAALIVGRGGDNCRADERGAKDVLTREWDNFSTSDRSHCQALVITGGPPSYVELLSCMEVSRDARRMAQQRVQPGNKRGGETTGAGPAAPADSAPTPAAPTAR